MKTFKVIDTWLNMLVVPLAIVYAFAVKADKMMYSYFIVGTLQVISMIIHQFNGWFVQPGSGRLRYHKIVLLLIASVALLIGCTQVAEFVYIPLMLIGYILLIVAPFMAAHYAYTCYEETYVKLRRPMALLK